MRAIVWLVLCWGLTACNSNSGGENAATGNSDNSIALAKPVLLTPANPIESASLPYALSLQWQYGGSAVPSRWDIVRDGVKVLSLNESAARQASFSLTQAGTSVWLVKACDAKSCVDSNAITVNLKHTPIVESLSKPRISGIAPTYRLSNGAASITAQWSKSSGAHVTRVEWLVNGIKQFSETLNSTQSSQFNFDVSSAGDYRFKLNVCDDKICVSSDEIRAIVNNIMPSVPQLTPFGSDFSLQNSTVDILVKWQASGESGNNWKLLLNDQIIHRENINRAPNQNASYVYRATATGNYSFVVWLCNDALCSESSAHTAKVIKVDTTIPPTETPLDAIGFYDVSSDGKARVIRNDLNGSLDGMVQFVQSHSVDPNGNAAKNMPKITAQREALLLFTPTRSATNSVTVTASINGAQKSVLQMRKPNEILRADSTNGDGRDQVVYSKRAFSVVLPWDLLTPGLSLSFEDEAKAVGVLASDKIEMAAPSELVLYSLRLGMLTDFPVSPEHYFLEHAEDGASDYFETLPISRLVLGAYESVKLNQVMIADGTIYATRSNVNGGVYEGDMREDVGKSQVSLGVDFANQGVIARDMNQAQPWISNIITAHHAQGLYANGVQSHGLSGGGGIATIYASEGNELSHEIGHNFGLGHYPGQNGENYFWSGHHADSGWGYIAHRQRMRGNLMWNAALGSGINKLNFNNLYAYNSDSMSGGEVDSQFSRYTHYTGYTARIIQDFLASHAQADLSSSTGWRKWDATAKQMKEHQPAVVEGRLKKIGVPVFTLLGGYVPTQNKAVMFPPFRGNYGNTFDMPAPANSGDRCWLDISFKTLATRSVALPAKSMGSRVANQFHLNIEEAEQPTAAKLFCQRFADGNIKRELGSVTFASGLTPMKKPVIVGREKRFSDLAAVELPQLEQALLNVSNKLLPVLDSHSQMLLSSNAGQLMLLSAEAQQIAQRYLNLRKEIAAIDLWMSSNAAAIDAKNSATLNELKAKLTSANVAELNAWLPTGSEVKVDGKCLALDSTSAQVIVKTCTNSLAERWLHDARGAIHSQQNSGLCLAGSSSSRVAVAACDADSVGQTFNYEGAKFLRWTPNPSRVMDYAVHLGYPLMYGYHGGSNQQWIGLLKRDNPLLVMLSANNLTRLGRLP